MRVSMMSSSALAGVVFALPVAAHAQAAKPVTAAAATQLEELLVTAQRYTTDVQSTPVAVTALSPTVLEERQVTNVMQAASQIPGVVITPATGTNNSARIVLRGAGQEQSGIQFDAAVGVYVDNVYQPRINGAFFDFFDIERLEVLRGPQGTLYGRNTSGGAIKIVTRQPSFEFTGGGDVAVGSYDTRDFRAYVSGPIIDHTLAFSLSGVARNHDGWTEAPAYGRKVNKKKSSGVRAALLWTPTDKAKVEVAWDFLRDHSDPGMGAPVQLLGQVPPSPLDPAAHPGRDLFSTELFGPISAKADSQGGSINASYALTPEVTLNSITGTRGMRATQAEPFTLTAVAGRLVAVGGSYIFHDRFYSQELNATYNTKRINGILGLYYFKEWGTIEDTPLFTAASALDIRDRRTTAKAIFAQGTVELTHGFSVEAGIRYTIEDAGFDQFYFNQVFAGQQVGRQFASKRFKATTPKVGLNWQYNDDTLLYVSYTKGFKSGGFNNINPSTNVGTPGVPAGPVPYGAEDVKSYEAGLKFQTPDHRFRINLAAYQADYAGLQLPVFFPGTTNTFTSNAAGARITGLEVEPTWQATDDLQIYGNLSLSHGKYTSDFQCSLFNTTIVNCKDKKIKGVVPTKSTLGFTYNVPMMSVPGRIRLGASWQYSSKYFNNVSNTLPIVQTPSYNLFDAFIAWDSPNRRLTISLEGKNIGDERFALESLQIASAVSPSVTAYPNDPRVILLRVKAGF